MNVAEAYDTIMQTKRSLMFQCTHHGLKPVRFMVTKPQVFKINLACGCIYREGENDWEKVQHRQQRLFGAPVILNANEPFTVAKEQLDRLDGIILRLFPQATLSTGCKYARWADIPVCVSDNDLGELACNQAYPDNIFDGVICGRKKLILMWLPYFD